MTLGRCTSPAVIAHCQIELQARVVLYFTNKFVSWCLSLIQRELDHLGKGFSTYGLYIHEETAHRVSLLHMPSKNLLQDITESQESLKNADCEGGVFHLTEVKTSTLN